MWQVMSKLVNWLLVLTTFEIVRASVCPQGKQFLHEELQVCVNCTICDSKKGDVVLRPCEVHRDTICGPLSELSLNWPPSENRHRHGGSIHHHRHRHHNGQHQQHHQQGAEDETYNVNLSHEETSFGEELASSASPEVAPFSTAETLVWDWQAIALTLAVFACILFFLVIAGYSLHQAKQWRRLKENFDADVEELSARLSLMAASTSEKGEILEPSMGPIHDGNYLKNRCVYLEQLLSVRKDTKIGSDTGNVYIEESNPGGGGGGGKT